ncbi:MAG TPA: hypothetical protein VL294_11740 [Pseudolysinimonas sp.]|jgi:hypothetical protein|nr:hypothetical protein [Pseudolysinimonas sp.]
MRIVIVIVFGLLHLWALFQGVSNLIALPGFYAQSGLAAYTPWWLLVLGVLVPVAALVAAVLIGRRRMLSHRVALLVVSLATANAFVLSAGALAPILLAWQAG